MHGAQCHRRPRHVAGNGSPRRDQRPDLFRLRQRHRSGRPALPDELRQPRRRPQRRRHARGAGRSLRRRLRCYDAASWGAWVARSAAPAPSPATTVPAPSPTLSAASPSALDCRFTDTSWRVSRRLPDRRPWTAASTAAASPTACRSGSMAASRGPGLCRRGRGLWLFDNQHARGPSASPACSRAPRYGRTDANQFLGQVEAGWRFGLVAPALLRHAVRAPAGLDATQNGFTETGAQSLSLIVAQQTTSSLRTIFGASSARR